MVRSFNSRPERHLRRIACGCLGCAFPIIRRTDYLEGLRHLRRCVLELVGRTSVTQTSQNSFLQLWSLPVCIWFSKRSFPFVVFPWAHTKRWIGLDFCLILDSSPHVLNSRRSWTLWPHRGAHHSKSTSLTVMVLLGILESLRPLLFVVCPSDLRW